RHELRCLPACALDISVRLNICTANHAPHARIIAVLSHRREWGKGVRQARGAFPIAAELIDHDDRTLAGPKTSKLRFHADSQKKGGERFRPPPRSTFDPFRTCT